MEDILEYKPLSRQVRDLVVQKIAEGVWRVGEPLPSEQVMAAEFGVSQGTVRQVLNTLTAEKLLERSQGRGTFIAEYTEKRSLYRFFRIEHPDGRRVTPESQANETVKLRASKAADQAKLNLRKGDTVVEINRTRLVDGLAAIREKIVVPAAMFPGLEARRPLENTLYSLYQSVYGIHITSVIEQISPELATAADARYLKVEAGAPILNIDRVAHSLHNLKVEWRVSRMVMSGLVYSVELT